MVFCSRKLIRGSQRPLGKELREEQNPGPLLVWEATPTLLRSALLRSGSGGGVLKNLGSLKVTSRPAQEALSTASKTPSQPGAALSTPPHPTPPSLLPQILQEAMKGMSLTECPWSLNKLPLLGKQGSLFKQGLGILLLKVHDELKA